MRVGSARAHLGCYPDRLHKFLPRRAMPHGGFGVATDAVGALRDMSDRDGDQLLCLDRQREPSANTFWPNASKASWIWGASCLRVSDMARENVG